MRQYPLLFLAIQAGSSVSEPKITVSTNASLKVEGGVTLVDAEGNTLETREGKPYYLCRCGQSVDKPFCDGAHNRCDFDGTLATGT